MVPTFSASAPSKDEFKGSIPSLERERTAPTVKFHERLLLAGVGVVAAVPGRVLAAVLALQDPPVTGNLWTSLNYVAVNKEVEAST